MTTISEDEWNTTYDPLETEDGTVALVSDPNNPAGICKLFEIANVHYIWTQYDGDDGYIIRPGFSFAGNGWYVCGRPWSDDGIVVEQEGSDNDDE